jgi:sigma-B regulation protein RsbU (phosphoserine phosphatase)
MLTGLVKSSFSSVLGEGRDPAAVAFAVAAAIRPYGYERFISMTCACVHPHRRELIYVNAGHPPPILWSTNRPPLELEATGPIISPALPDTTWESCKIPLSPGDRLLLYTDGLREASSGHEDFGTDRIRAALERWPAGGPAMLDALLAEVDRFRAGRPPTDDLTIVTAALPD